MKKLLLIALLIFSFGAQAALFGERPKLVVHGRTFVGADLDNLVILKAFVSSATTFSSFFTDDGTAYSPTSGGYRILAVRIWTGGAANSVALLFGDDSSAVNDPAPTTPIFENGLAGTIFPYVTDALATTDFPYEFVTNFFIPEGKFPHLKIASAVATTAIIYGIETVSGS